MNRINLRQRNDRWQLDFYYDDPISGKRRRCQRTSPYPQKGKSYDWGMALLIELETPPAPPERERLTLAQLWDRYEQTLLPKLKPSTRQSRVYCVTARILPALGDLDIEDVDAYALDRYATARHTDGASPKTIKNELGIITTILRAGQRWGLLDRVPTTSPPKAEPQHIRYLVPYEARMLLSAAADEPYMSTLVPALLYTGMRLGEALALRWEHVDLEAGYIDVLYSHSAGHTTAPKSGKGRRIPLSREGRAALSAQRAQRRPGPLVWQTHEGAQLTRGHVRDPWRRVLMASGIAHTRLHDLRHTYASWLVQSGVSLQAVKELLGHADVKTTLRYAHLAPSTLSDAVARLDSFGDRLVTAPHLSVVAAAK